MYRKIFIRRASTNRSFPSSFPLSFLPSFLPAYYIPYIRTRNARIARGSLLSIILWEQCLNELRSRIRDSHRRDYRQYVTAYRGTKLRFTVALLVPRFQEPLNYSSADARFPLECDRLYDPSTSHHPAIKPEPPPPPPM